MKVLIEVPAATTKTFIYELMEEVMASVNIIDCVDYAPNTLGLKRFEEFVNEPKYHLMYIIVHEDVKDICTDIIKSISEEAVKHIVIDQSQYGSRESVKCFGYVDDYPIVLMQFEILSMKPILNLSDMDRAIMVYKNTEARMRVFLVTTIDTLKALENEGLVHTANFGKYYEISSYRIPIAIFEGFDKIGQVEVMYDNV